jgi:dipeptidyl aminopeptidase/acylaminoacyl peptidase
MFSTRAFASMVAVLIFGSCIAYSQQAERKFTVPDDIGLALEESIQFSPDAQFFAVYSERGRLDLDRVEDSLRFYKSADVKAFLDQPNEPQYPSPLWIVTRSSVRTDNLESPIERWRWLANSSGVAFLERTSDGTQRLVLATLPTKRVDNLTPVGDNVTNFDIRDRRHYVYTVIDPSAREKFAAENRAPAVVAGQQPLHQVFYRLFFPDDPLTQRILGDRSYLWAAVGGKPFVVKRNGVPLTSFGSFALSPNRDSIVTTLPVADVPSSWETLYPPPPTSDVPSRVRAGHYDATSQDGPAHEYVQFDLQTGSILSLTGAPRADDAGWWWGYGDPSWSTDGESVLLPGTFIRSEESGRHRPCVAVVELHSKKASCVEEYKKRGWEMKDSEENYHLIMGAGFRNGDKHRVDVNFLNPSTGSPESTEYELAANGPWQAVAHVQGDFEAAVKDDLHIVVKQDLNVPPVVVASRNEVSRVLWDPNPQLKDFDLAKVSVYSWKDPKGREWTGGLYRPLNYRPGQRYPLVIQTHGFSEGQFRPAGAFSTAFAAQELAAAGIMVLQMKKPCPFGTAEEGPCAVSGYEAGVSKLASEGLVDPDNVGVIGFSRTCFDVMEMLTTGSLHLKAADVTDGTMKTYLQYMMFGPDREADVMIGAKPFGEGLQEWLKRSPGFNLDKITTPLLIVSGGSMPDMWEPYAGLRYLNKPVELIKLNAVEHPYLNPAVRMVSQSSSVDWFRFWLQGYERTEPVTAAGETKESLEAQYVRWRKLQELQEANDKKTAEAKPPVAATVN